jgi:hypothetical protein
MTSKHWFLGFGGGVLATLVMTAVMFIGQGTGLSPMPQPIPVALAARVLGHATPRPLLLTVGLTAHLLYGGAAGAILWRLARRVTLVLGLGWGVVLWIVMGLVALPFLGWGIFGSALTPKIAVATLLLHLIYGGTLGALGQILPGTRGEHHMAARGAMHQQH